MNMTSRMRGAASALVLAFAGVAGGCSAGDVELNGSVFDYLGVGSKSQNTSRDAKVAERQALVVPPNLERLPAPGSGEAESQIATSALPVNPEQRRVAAATQAEKQHREICDKALIRAKVNKDLSPVTGPLGRCEASLLDQISVQSPISVDAGGPAAPARKP
jgi:hypothetical protein